VGGRVSHRGKEGSVGVLTVSCRHGGARARWKKWE
jgi:hypothetical protein